MKKTLLTLLQIAVTVTVLFYVFRNPEKNAQMAAAVRASDLRWLLAALVAAQLPILIATTRWWLLLRVQAIPISWPAALRIYLIGAFFNLFLPGSTGGDAVKAYYALRKAPPEKRAGAVLTVVLDRVLGLLALVLIASVFVVWRHSWLTADPAAARWVWTFESILAFAVFGILVTVAIIGFDVADRLPARMPGRSKFIELSAASRLYGHAWGTSLAALGVSAFGHFTVFAAFYFAARALQATVSFWDMAAVLPVINTIVSMPVSLSGVGVREGLFKELLGALCGVPERLSVPISVLGFIFTVLVPGVIGGIVYILQRSSTGAAPAIAELERMEEQTVAGRYGTPAPATTGVDPAK